MDIGVHFAEQHVRLNQTNARMTIVSAGGARTVLAATPLPRALQALIAHVRQRREAIGREGAERAA